MEWPEGRKGEVEVRTLALMGDNQSVVEWLNGETRQNKHKDTVVKAQKDLHDLWTSGGDLTTGPMVGPDTFIVNTTPLAGPTRE